MHIILALLSGLGGLAWAIFYLDRAGFDFASLNPFLWKRRAAWKRQYLQDPLFALHYPLEVAGVLMLGIAKETGQLSLDEKAQIKEFMVQQLNQSSKSADDLFQLATHLLRDHPSIVGKVSKIIAPCKEHFTREHVQTIERLLAQIAGIGGSANHAQQALMQEFEQEFVTAPAKGSWA